MTTLNIGIVLSTARSARFADRPASWLLDLAKPREEARFEIVDLRDHKLPFFDEQKAPIWEPPKDPAAQAWCARIARFDGYVFVTAEYNRGIPAVLKNALDHTYFELHRKPAGFIGYGGVGAARAIEQLRLVLVELHVAPLRNAVHIGLTEFLGLLYQGKTFEDYPHLAKSAAEMLDDLIWWTRTLKAGREASPA